MHKTIRSFTAIFLLSGLLVAASQTSAEAGQNEGKKVVLFPMLSFASPESGPDADAIAGADAMATELGAITATLPAGTEAEQEAALQVAGADANAKWKKKLEQIQSTNGGGETAKTSRIYGDCGWSEITLQNATGDNIGYVQARFQINRPGYAYRVNVHVWDTAWNDFSEWDFPDTGSLYGGTSYEDSFTFRVDENNYYGAKMNRGEVYVGNNTWCYTGVPTVDDVWIQ